MSAGLLLLLVAVIGVGRLAIGLLPERDAPVSVTLKKVPGKTEEQRQAFFAELGWVVGTEPCEVVDVIIPKEFDEVYTSYNALQEDQGLGLERYRGKRCKRYTYIVENHPSGAKDVRANLLIYSGKIIGGDVCSLGLDGFMHGMVFPEAAAQAPSQTPSAAPQVR